MNKRFVLLSDLHLHPWAAFAKGDGASNTRLLQTLAVLSASLNRARALGVPWVFGGDIVHTAGYTLNVVMSRLIEVMALYNDVTKLAVWGNHDARGVGGKIMLEQTVLGTLQRSLSNFCVLDPSATTLAHAGGLTFSGAGYQPRPEFLELAQESDVGIYHQTVRGSKTPTGFVLEEGIAAKDLAERHRFAAVGHVHHWQYADGVPTGRVLIPGSPEQHNFGDMGAHGWWVITLGDDSCEAQMAPGGSPEFRTVDSPRDVQDDGNYYRVRFAGNDALPKNATAIAPSPTVVEQRNVLQGARGEQVLEAWAKIAPPGKELDVSRVLAVGKELVRDREATNLRSYRLTRVGLKNFCSYADAKLQVTPGTWLVVGKGKDFPSNGAGKTTLFESIFWLLFGSTTKGLTGDDVIRRGAEDCQVSAELESDADVVQIVRRRGSGSKLTVTIYDSKNTGLVQTIEGKSINEVTEKLQKYLGVTPDLFKSLAYFSQEDLVLFASATDGMRKDMLADLIGLGAYQEAATAAGKKADELLGAEHQLTALHDAAVQRRVLEESRLCTAVANAERWFGDHMSRVALAEQVLEDFDNQQEVLRTQMVAEGVRTLGQTIAAREQQATVQLERAQAEALLPAGVTFEQKEVVEANTAAARAAEDVRAIQARIIEVRNRLIAQRSLINRHQETLAGGQCPTCLQTVSSVHVDVCLQSARAECTAIEAHLKALEADQLATVERAANAKLCAQEVNAGFEAGKLYKARQNALNGAHAALLEVQRDKDALGFDVGTNVDKVLDERRLALASAITRIHQEHNPFAREVDSITERIKEIADEVQRHAAQRQQLTVDAATYEYWRRGFSKQGVQSLLLDEVAGLFNECRGSIFPALTQGVYDVQFSTLSRTKAGDARERTEFQVFERGQQVPYASLSGGQRRRIDVGVMLTLVKAVSLWMQVPGALGILVLDEVFSFLDSSGAEGLMEALREIQQQIPAIFAVSHDPQLQALFPETITVIQDQDGVSRLAGS